MQRQTRLVLSAIGLTAVLRLPSLFWPVISDDEGIYEAMARTVQAHGTMYVQAVDHKPPGLVHLYVAIEWLASIFLPGLPGITAVHFFGIVVAAFTAYGLVLAARELLDEELAWIPAALYALCSVTRSAHDGLAVNGELVMNLPIIFSVWALLQSVRRTGPRRVGFDILAGSLIAIAGLVKWQALAALCAFPFLAPKGLGAGLPAPSAVLRRIPAWMLGLAIPFGLTALFFWNAGALADAWAWGGLFNVRYIAEGPDLLWSLQRLGLALAGLVLPSALFYTCAMDGLGRRVRANDSLGLVLWTLSSIACVAIGGRYFGHYFLQPELPLAILAAPAMRRLFLWRPPVVAAALAIPALFFTVVSSSPRLTHSLFDPGDPDWTAVSHELATASGPQDTLFVWGNVPSLYALSDRAMGTRFAFCNYLTGLSPGTRSEYQGDVHPEGLPGAWPKLLDDLNQRRPTLILDTAAAGWKGYGKFPIAGYAQFAAVLASRYMPVAKIQGATLYRLR